MNHRLTEQQRAAEARATYGDTMRVIDVNDVPSLENAARHYEPAVTIQGVQQLQRSALDAEAAEAAASATGNADAAAAVTGIDDDLDDLPALEDVVDEEDIVEDGGVMQGLDECDGLPSL